MKKLPLFFLLSIFLNLPVQAQSVLGRWENRNEEGKVNSIVKVYEKDDKIFGKVDHIVNAEDRDRICTLCEGELKDQPIQGLEVMKGLEKEGDEYVGGTIVDPKTGKKYRCKIWLDENNPDILKVRGYISFFYKTKTWRRVK
ncbi:DUF2147 domain-containing protein [Pontixanthobacter gangjinensis]|uniref:DUF2147 domain-containing protein n=1 Tax=Christiangramia aestuarii TaxID=1028746 RepID=A0A7K1LP94_9FLAO|nr:DUF2147 domain-containing protein [Christiangramia aestuarii]MUP42629.1 DUF2147 domain-containing protein [Christiangramia aestuarii]